MSPQGATVPDVTDPAPAPGPSLRPVRASDPAVVALLDALTVELASAGYSEAETFGYSVEQLERAGVQLLGATRDGRLVGVGGVELDGDEGAELKRFYVRPEHRGTGVADTLLGALLDQAAAHGVRLVRLETGDRQHAAMGFYRRHGFTVVPAFGPYVGSRTSVCMARALDDPTG